MGITRTDKRTHLRLLTLAAALLFLLAAVVTNAFADHYQSSLEGSNFEIDDDANLAVDEAPMDDWESVTFDFQSDGLQGTGDNAFKGSGESDPCPEVAADSIPPNKSDLTGAGFFVEPGTGGTDLGFLHLFWSRVQDPSGSTDMDFELNQNDPSVLCTFTKGNKTLTGETPVRAAGDLLIEYHITSGGSSASMFIREWDGTAWGDAVDISTSNKGAGTINTSAIGSTSVSTDEGNISVGPFSPRTFGEASVDLSELFPTGTCKSFGSAYLKSRSSFSFNSALKDFVSPQPVELSNCGRIVVEKVDENGDPLDGAEFTVTPGQTVNGEGTNDDDVMDEIDTGLFCLDDLLIGVEYTVSETQTPPGYLTADDQTHTVTEIGTCDDVTSDDVDLQFENLPADRDVTLAKVDDDGEPLEGVGFTLFIDDDESGTLEESEDTEVDPPGEVLTDGEGVATFQDIVFGFYCVVETSPLDGYTPIDGPVCFELTTGTGAFQINGGTALVNDQEHKVIVIVCHEGTGTLAPSGYNDEDTDTAEQTTIGSGDVSNDEETFLCGLDGFSGKPHGEEDYTVDVTH